MTEAQKKELMEQAVEVAFKALFTTFKAAQLETHISCTIDADDGHRYYLRFEKVDTK